MHLPGSTYQLSSCQFLLAMLLFLLTYAGISMAAYMVSTEHDNNMELVEYMDTETEQEQEEECKEEKMKDELFYSKLPDHFKDESSLCYSQQCTLTLTSHFAEVISPPPEYYIA